MWTASIGSFALWFPGGFGQWEILVGDQRVQRKCGQGVCSTHLPPCWVARAWPQSWVHPSTRGSVRSVPGVHTTLLWTSGSGKCSLPSFFSDSPSLPTTTLHGELYLPLLVSLPLPPIFVDSPCITLSSISSFGVPSVSHQKTDWYGD